MDFDGILRRKLYWMNDRLHNSSLVRKQYDEIMYALSEGENLWLEWQQQKENLLMHAVATTNFYSQYYGEKFDEFPVINKKICLENYDRFISSGYLNQDLHRMSTNGSSGTPFTILQDAKKRSRVIAELKAFMAIRGLFPNQKMIYLDAMSARNKHKTKYEQWKENIWRIDISSLGRTNVEEIITFMQKYRGKLVLGYPSTMDWLANYSENDTRIRNLGFKTVITAGETLHSETRRKAKATFGDQCDILSRYSNQEMGILGQEKKEYGSYLLNHSSYFFECLKLNEDKPAEDGEIGRIVITDLYNYAFPLIRYDTEDTGIMGMDNDVSIYPVLKVVYGKKKDILYNYKKEPIIPDVIDEIFYGKINIKQWKLIQEDYAKVRLLICCNEQGKKDVEVICGRLKVYFGDMTQIMVDYVESIPDDKGGKYRYIVCKIAK